MAQHPPYLTQPLLVSGQNIKTVGGESLLGSGDVDAVSSADLQAALADSPALGGTPTAPTASTGTNTAQIATTAFVQDAIEGVRLGDIPPLRPGVSILFEERFSDATGFSANWDSVENDSLVKGGVVTGPRLKTNGTGDEFRFAFCVKKPTAAENSAGYLIPQASKALPSTGFVAVSFFFRPGFFHTFLPTQGAVLCHTRDQFNNPNTFLGVEITKDSESLVRFRSGPYYTPETSDWFPVGEWYRVWIALDIDGKKSQTFIKRMYDDQVISFSEATHTYENTSFYLGSYFAGVPANQPWVNGQISAIRIYSCQSMDQAKDEPQDYIMPENGIEIELSKEGDDTNINGPIRTIGRAFELIDQNVVIGSRRNYQSLTGVDKDYEALQDTANRERFCVDYVNGKIRRNPQNDTIRVRTGVYKTGSDLELRSPPIGVGLIGDEGVEIRFATELNGSWSNPDGSHPRAWLYSEAVSPEGVAYAPGRVCFTPIQAANVTEAKTRLSAKNWGCWVSSSGELWVSLPGGTTPAALAALTPSQPWEYSLGGMPAFTGGHLENVKITGLTRILYNIGANGRVEIAYGGWSTQAYSCTTVFDRVTCEGYTKHTFALVGNNNESLTLFLSPRFGGQVPPQDNSWDGAFVGDFSSLIDYSSADSVDGNLVSFYYDPQSSDVGYRAIPGRATSPTWSSGQGRPLYAHDSGGIGKPYALCLVAFPKLKPSGWEFPESIETSHQNYEIVEYFGSFRDLGETNLSIANRGGSTLYIASDTGTDATIPAATTSLSGLLTSADKTKLDGLPSVSALAALRPVITDQPDSQPFEPGDTITFSVVAATIANTHLSLSYQWQRSIDNGASWSNVAGATSSSYTTPTLSGSDAGYQYRCLVSNQIGTETSNSATLQALLLDVFSGATAAYSLRRLREDYVGDVVRVRRSSDSAESDFSAAEVSDGTLLSWVGAGSGFVTTWYDQVGSNNAVQATSGNQPRIVNAGVLETNDKGFPCVRFIDASGSSVGQHLVLSPFHANSTAWVGVLAVYQFNASGFFPYLLGSNPADRGIIPVHDDSTREIRTAVARTEGVPVADGPALTLSRSYLRLDVADRSLLRTFLNNMSAAVVSVADRNENFNMPTEYWLGSANANVMSNDSSVAEVILFSNDISATQEAIRTKITLDYNLTV